MDTSEQVALLRGNAGLTQQELACLSGVAQSNIAAYETGRRRPSDRMLTRLRDAAKPRPSVALAAHRKQVLAIAKKRKALDVKVFGSVARNDDRPGSDVDLLVRFAPDASLFDQIELAQDLEDLLGVRVDVVSENGLLASHADIKQQARPL